MNPITPEFWISFWEAIYIQLIILVILMFADLLFGVLVALIQKKFDWDYLPEFLINDGMWILAWLISMLILAFPKEFIPELLSNTFSIGVYATVAGKIAASLLGHWSALGLFTGIMTKIAIYPTGNDDGDAGLGSDVSGHGYG